MSSYIKAAIRIESCNDADLEQVDFDFGDLSIDLGAFTHLVHIPEQETPATPGTVALADVGGWTGGNDNLIAVINTGSNSLTLGIELAAGATSIELAAGAAMMITDIELTDPTVSSVSGTTFKALLAGK